MDTEPRSIEDIAWEEWSHGEGFGGRVRALTMAGAGPHLGMLIEELAPGRQSCPAHWHSEEEEHVLGLEGAGLLRLGEKTVPFKAGDYVRFPANSGVAHCLINPGPATFRYLVVGERRAADTCFYPDSNKVFSRAAKLVFNLNDAVDYWQDEAGPRARDIDSRD